MFLLSVYSELSMQCLVLSGQCSVKSAVSLLSVNLELSLLFCVLGVQCSVKSAVSL